MGGGIGKRKSVEARREKEEEHRPIDFSFRSNIEGARRPFYYKRRGMEWILHLMALPVARMKYLP